MDEFQCKLWKCRICAIVSFMLAVMIMSAKGVLLTIRYVNAAKTCSNETTEDEEYIFTVVVYSCLSALRILEYILLGAALVKFVFDKNLPDLINMSSFSNNWSHQKRSIYLWFLFWIVSLIPYVLLGVVVIPTLGILQEINNVTESDETECNELNRIYIAYCAVNVLRYLCDALTRIGMIFATLIIGKICFKLPTGAGNGSRNRLEESNHSDHDQEGRIYCEQFVEDWIITTEYLENQVTAYHRQGKTVEKITDIFQTWFMIPWIVYFVATSLEVNKILQPWTNNSKTYSSIYPQIYYFFYNINQLVTLVIPYLCAKKINTYHQDYHQDMDETRLSQFKHSTGQLTFASMQHIQKEEDYEFVPRIIGSSIKIPTDSPLYIVFLLAGFFFTVYKTLF